MENLHKRRPLVAFLLSFLTLGFGQLYNGQFKRAIILYSIAVLTVILLLSSSLFSTFYGMISCLVVAIGYRLFVMIDALYNAIKLKEIQIRRYNKWYLYLVIILIQAFAVQPLMISSAPFKAYKMPAGSMEPTLLVGDHFVIDRTCYDKRGPERGDVIVFKYPLDAKKDYIKRVIGLPGERVELANKQLLINGQPVEDPKAHYSIQGNLRQFGPVSVPANNLFVM